MKKLLMGLILLTSMSSFAFDLDIIQKCPESSRNALLGLFSNIIDAGNFGQLSELENKNLILSLKGIRLEAMEKNSCDLVEHSVSQVQEMLREYKNN